MDILRPATEPERRILRTLTDDGIVDLLLGAWFVGVGLTAEFRLTGLLVGMAVATPFVWRMLRRTLVEPRVGAVTWGNARLRGFRGFRRWTPVLMAAGLASAFLAHRIALSYGAEVPETRAPLLRAAALAAPLVLGAVLYRTERLVVYAGVLLVAGVVAARGGVPTTLGEFVTAGVMFAVGGLRLASFLRDHPRPEEAECEV